MEQDVQDAQEVEEVLSSMRHNKREKDEPYKLKLRNWLNTIFILLALLTVVFYFMFPLPDGQLIIFVTCSLAIMVKMAEATIRMTRKRSKK